jgi:iron(III) transport system substrate-binding protein
MRLLIGLLTLGIIFVSCNKEEIVPDKKRVWIYSSLWKGTINDINDRLSKKFPDIEFHWFRDGSEEIAIKADSQILTDGQINADIIIATSRLWMQEKAKQGYFSPIEVNKVNDIPLEFKHKNNLFASFSIPVTVPVYNSKKILSSKAPKSFKDLANIKWMKKIAIGNPLSSGTNFTTLAMLQHHYGWDYVRALKKNKTISNGGNGTVYKTLKSEKSLIGWMTMDIILRYQNKQSDLSYVYPTDGVIIQQNVLALPKKNKKKEYLSDVVTWFFSDEAQQLMIDAYSYSPFLEKDPPKGARPLKELMKGSFKWNISVIESVNRKRKELREGFTEILFK